MLLGGQGRETTSSGASHDLCRRVRVPAPRIYSATLHVCKSRPRSSSFFRYGAWTSPRPATRSPSQLHPPGYSARLAKRSIPLRCIVPCPSRWDNASASSFPIGCRYCSWTAPVPSGRWGYCNLNHFDKSVDLSGSERNYFDSFSEIF